MDTDPSPVRLWESEGHSDGYRTCFPSESEEMVPIICVLNHERISWVSIEINYHENSVF